MSTAATLLTPTERHAFDAFLTASVEPAEDEWQLYTQLGIPVPLPLPGNASLANATKALIALHPPPKYPNNNGGSIPSAGPSGQAFVNSGASHHRPIAPAPPPQIHSRSPQQQYPPSPSQSHGPTADRPQKRARHSVSSSGAHSTPPPPTPQPGPSNAKPALLTAQQKKANHIQSEQKRRANIRKGYEALCETIPALREAIRAEEDAASHGNAGKKRRAREEGGEKTDGRAGPRSESVVLQKTIEHIQGLFEQKSTLLSRLERARGMLGPGHPALQTTEEPLWEREWDGGKGIMVDVNGEVLNGNDHDSDDD
ncbi:hypothetical protein M422DRAFT_26097 [Sphaerobolus stellatus SS14]|nr:hypothetical protein M422DRAFT_26097 [Sphaerobolus stellatus SS14]